MVRGRRGYWNLWSEEMLLMGEIISIKAWWREGNLLKLNSSRVEIHSSSVSCSPSPVPLKLPGTFSLGVRMSRGGPMIAALLLGTIPALLIRTMVVCRLGDLQ